MVLSYLYLFADCGNQNLLDFIVFWAREVIAVGLGLLFLIAYAMNALIKAIRSWR